MMEPVEAFLFAFSKTESEMLAVIAVAKTAIEFLFVSNQFADVREILVAQCAQPIRNRFWIGYFRSHEPERINERKAHKFFPVFAKVPKLEFISMLFPETNGLVANEQTRASFRGRRCRSCDEPWR